MLLRAFGFISLGLVVGFVLGGMPAKRELRALQDDYEVLEDKLRRADRPNMLRALLPGLVGGPGAGDARGRPAAGQAPAAAKPDQAGAGKSSGDGQELQDAPRGEGGVYVVGKREDGRPGGAEYSANGATDGNTGASERPPAWWRRTRRGADGERQSPRERFSSGEARQNFKRMLSAQRARSASARAALISNADLNEEQVAQVDQAVNQMNEELAGYGEEMVASVANDEPPETADTLEMASDMTRIMHEAQVTLDEVVGDGAEVPPVWDLFSPPEELEEVAEDYFDKAEQGELPVPSTGEPSTPAPAPVRDAGA